MRQTLIAVIAVFALTSSAREQNVASAKPEVVNPDVVKITDRVYMIHDSGGNIGVSVGEDGIVLIDDQFGPLAPTVKAALQTISGKPIRFVIKTHVQDHPAESGISSREGTIVAHENVFAQLQKRAKVGGRQTAPARKAPAMVTYTDNAKLYANGEEIRLHHFPNGHSGGDTIVQFTKSNVVHMGDDFAFFTFPAVDRANGGTVKGLIAALDAILAVTDKETLFIPGNGRGLGDWPVLDSYRDALKGTVAILNEAVRAGKTLEEVKKEKTLVAWEHLSSDFLTLETYTEGLFHELEGTPAKAH